LGQNFKLSVKSTFISIVSKKLTKRNIFIPIWISWC